MHNKLKETKKIIISLLTSRTSKKNTIPRQKKETTAESSFVFVSNATRRTAHETTQLK